MTTSYDSSNSSTVQRVSNPDDSLVGSITATTVTGSANGAGQFAVTAIDVSAYRSISMQTSGTYSLVQVFECSNDAVTWSSCPMQSVPLVPLAENTSVTGAGQSIYACNVNFKYFRNRISSYTSGTINTILVLSPLASALPTQPVQAAQDGTWTVQPGNTANTTPWLINQSSDYPSSATPATASSGNVANASAAATLTGVSGKTIYLTGFEVTGSGATAGSVVTVTVTGTVTGTLSYTYAAVTGALLLNTPLIVQFSKPIPASNTNTSIVVTCPALGAGNTNSTVVAHGYIL